MTLATDARASRRPTAAVWAAGRLLWDVSLGAVRDFVWGDLRKGLLSLHGLPTTTRVLALLGFGLLIAMTLALLWADVWRTQFALIPLTRGLPGRGTLLPNALVPATWFVMALSWSFWLGGALHSWPLIRIGALLLYLIVAIGWVSGTSFANERALQVCLAMLAAVPLTFLARWRDRIRPALEFGMLFTFVCVTFALVQQQGLESWAASDEPIMLVKLNVDVLSLRSFINPMLVLAGMGVATFALQLGSWGSTVVAQRTPRPFALALLLLAIGWLAYTTAADLAGQTSAGADSGLIGAYASGLVGLGLIGLAWCVVSRIHDRARPEATSTVTVHEVADAAESRAMPLIVLFSAMSLITVLATGVLWALFVLRVVPSVPGSDDVFFAFLSNQATHRWWEVSIGLGLCALAAWLAHRGHHAAALYLGVFGLLTAWSRLGSVSGPLPWFSRSAAPLALDVWWVAVLVSVSAALAIRGRLSAERVSGLLTLTLILILLRQTDFLSNRFSPLFGSAGVAFLAFGVLWDILTVGSWANHGSPKLPRESRIFLYLGYALLSVAVVNWALTVHDLGTVNQLTGEATLGGFERFGKPLLYAAFLAMLAPLKGQRSESPPLGTPAVNP